MDSNIEELDSVVLSGLVLRCGCWGGEGCLLTKEASQCSRYDDCNLSKRPTHIMVED
jgi:hypothetical protein